MVSQSRSSVPGRGARPLGHIRSSPAQKRLLRRACAAAPTRGLEALQQRAYSVNWTPGRPFVWPLFWGFRWHSCGASTSLPMQLKQLSLQARATSRLARLLFDVSFLAMPITVVSARWNHPSTIHGQDNSSHLASTYIYIYTQTIDYCFHSIHILHSLTFGLTAWAFVTPLYSDLSLESFHSFIITNLHSTYITVTLSLTTRDGELGPKIGRGAEELTSGFQLPHGNALLVVFATDK